MTLNRKQKKKLRIVVIITVLALLITAIAPALDALFTG